MPTKAGYKKGGVRHQLSALSGAGTGVVHENGISKLSKPPVFSKGRGVIQPNHTAKELIVPDLPTHTYQPAENIIESERAEHQVLADVKSNYNMAMDERVRQYLKSNEIPVLRLAGVRLGESTTKGFEGPTRKRFERRTSLLTQSKFDPKLLREQSKIARRRTGNRRRPPPVHISKPNTKLLYEGRWSNRQRSRPRIQLVPGVGSAVGPKEHVAKEFFAPDLPFVPVPPPESRGRFEKPPARSYRRNKAYEMALQGGRRSDETAYYLVERERGGGGESESHAQQLQERQLVQHSRDVYAQDELRRQRAQKEQENVEEKQARLWPESVCQHEGFSVTEAMHVQQLETSAVGKVLQVASAAYLATTRGPKHRSTTFNSVVPIGSKNTSSVEEARQAALAAGVRVRARDSRINTGSAADQRRFLRSQQGLEPLPEPRRPRRNRY
jgi:hypothetical protein